MILVVGTVRVPPEAFNTAHDAMAKVVAATRQEEGCIRYAYARDVLDPGIMHISEAWRDRAALTAHFTTPHMLKWREVIGTIGATERDLRLHETDEGEPL